MRIVFSSYAFHPSIGGIESTSDILAQEFAAAGHQVELVTATRGEPGNESNYSITRRPSLLALLRLLRWCDVLFQNNISLRYLIPALVMQKRAIVVHQTWIRNTRGQIGWNGRLKRLLLPHVTNVSISEAIAEDLGGKSIIIPNPYRDELFRVLTDTRRDKTLIFVGRLVSDKGVDLLLRSLARLRLEGLEPDLTVVGAGPEAENLSALARELAVQDQVSFAGQKTGEELVHLLNQHRIMVIPSRWAEPFGVVALEGISCGCAVIGSEAGGLKEAIGPCGITFENSNEQSLANALKRLLQDRALEDSLRRAGPKHLERFKAQNVADEYLQLINAPVS